MTDAIIYWFRQDLRVQDLPGLLAAAATGKPLVACYILDDDAPGEHRPGGASRWWLHHSLASLQEELRALGGEPVETIVLPDESGLLRRLFLPLIVKP